MSKKVLVTLGSLQRNQEHLKSYEALHKSNDIIYSLKKKV